MTRRTRAAALTAGVLAVSVPFALAAQETAPSPTEEPAALSPAADLGRQLFVERNFTNPGADYGSSCHECHVDGARAADRSEREFADSVARSLLAGKSTTVRNTPTLLDAASWRSNLGEEWLGGWDGAATDLEQLILAKLTGPASGWPAGDQRAAEAIAVTLMAESPPEGDSYAERIQAAFDVDISTLDATDSALHAAKALAEYVRTLDSTQTAKWDAFAEQNRLRKAPNPGESATDYAFGIETRIGNQEGRRLIKRPEGFTEEAYKGFRVFFRTVSDLLDETAGVGQCVTCHTPPLFRDGKFHNTGVSEMEYDAIWGEGAADTVGEPSRIPRIPTRDDAAAIDLGRWHPAPGEEGSRGAFKTPGLRNLGGQDPYLHNGSAATLEDVIRQKMRASELARQRKLRHVDPLVAGIQISEGDIAPLVAFLEQLEDVGAERFRYYLIHLEE